MQSEELHSCSGGRFGSAQALGTRQYLGEHDVGARFPIKKFGETGWLTYQQVCRPPPHPRTASMPPPPPSAIVGDASSLSRPTSRRPRVRIGG